jgi:hypothetical protein
VTIALLPKLLLRRVLDAALAAQFSDSLAKLQCVARWLIFNSG